MKRNERNELMAHEVEIRGGGASMMYVGAEPWHGLGTQVATEVTSAAALKVAGLDWDVVKKPIGVVSDLKVDDIPVVAQVIPGQYAAIRQDDGKILSIVSETYTIIQNREQFEFMDTLVGDGLAMYHTAGSLRGGKQVFLLVKLPESITIADWAVDQYILLTSSHDYTMPTRILWTPVRVVCWNTLSLALDDMRKSFSIRHTVNWKEKEQLARDTLQLSHIYYQALKQKLESLALIKMGDAILEDMLEKMYPISSTRMEGRISEVRSTVRELFFTGAGNDGKTGLDFVNAVAEYHDHREYRDSKNSSGEDKRFVAATEDYYGMKNLAVELVSGLA